MHDGHSLACMPTTPYQAISFRSVWLLVLPDILASTLLTRLWASHAINSLALRRSSKQFGSNMASLKAGLSTGLRAGATGRSSAALMPPALQVR